MPEIEINIRGVICASESIETAKKEVASARTGIRGTARFIDPQIRSRDDLDMRLNQLCRDMDQIENKMIRIARVVSDGANKYRTVENQAVSKASELLLGKRSGNPADKSDKRALFKS